MKICEKLKSIFKSSSDNEKNEMTNIEFKFGDLTQKDIGTLSIDDFKIKCENETQKMIKNILSMDREECEKNDAYYSEIFEAIRGIQRNIRFSNVLSTKYQFFYSCLKRYQNELRKRLDRSK